MSLRFSVHQGGFLTGDGVGESVRGERERGQSEVSLSSGTGFDQLQRHAVEVLDQRTARVSPKGYGPSMIETPRTSR